MQKFFYLYLSFLLTLSIGCTSNIYKYSKNIKDPNLICRVLDPGLSEFYQGDCKNELASGIGKAEGSNKYEGNFKNGLPHGKGVYKWSSGESYDGEWINGNRNGIGTYTKSDGVSYKGYYRNGNLTDGRVTITYKNKSKRIGTLVNGKLHGVVTYGSDTEYWRNGKNVTSYVHKCRTAKAASSAYKGIVSIFNMFAAGARGDNIAEGGAWGYNAARKKSVIRAIDCTCDELLRQFD